MANETITPNVVSRQDAKRLGLERYFTGKTCINGHISERYALGQCVACASDFYQNNKDTIKQRVSKWGKDNPEKFRATQRKHRKNNPETFKKIGQRYREKHPEQVKARHKSWIKRNREKATQYNSAYSKRRYHEDLEKSRMRGRIMAQRRRALKRNAKGSFTKEDVAKMLLDQNGLCNGCRKDISKRHTVDHIVPLFRGGSNDPSNLQLLCHSCNSRKYTRTMDEWVATLTEEEISSWRKKHSGTSLQSRSTSP